jgi:L-threonylcarbamoyladenylate synthase
MEHIFWENADTIDILKMQLLNQHVFLGQTDTVLGLMANADQIGLNALNTIKDRNSKPYIVLVGELLQIENIVSQDIWIRWSQFLKCIWPGKVTVIFPKKPDLIIDSGCKTIAVRFPAHEYLAELARSFDFGIFSTSANLSGSKIPLSIDKIEDAILKNIEVIVTNKNDICLVQHISLPSTIVDCTGNNPQIIREGIVSAEIIEKIWNDSQKIM